MTFERPHESKHKFSLKLKKKNGSARFDDGSSGIFIW